MWVLEFCDYEELELYYWDFYGLNGGIEKRNTLNS